MPRRPRFDLPGTLHHVCVRGVDGQPIFRDDADRHDLVARFERWLEEFGAECLAWCFQGNHLHLLLRRHTGSLADLMARFTSAYAQRFNRRHGRAGHLLQGRYESRLIERDDDLRWMLAYVSGNSVRHGRGSPDSLVREQWNAYAGLMGLRPLHPFESMAALLAFDDDVSRARAALSELIATACANQWRQEAASLEAVIAAACERHGVVRAALRGKSRAATCARGEIVMRAVRELGLSWLEVASALGVSRGAIHRALSRAPADRPQGES